MAASGDVLDAAVGHLVNIYIYGAHCVHVSCVDGRRVRLTSKYVLLLRSEVIIY